MSHRRSSHRRSWKSFGWYNTLSRVVSKYLWKLGLLVESGRLSPKLSVLQYL